MENNFDKYFKDKLEHRKFEMKPEFWEEAEALIEADEKDKDRRRFLIWFLVFMLVGGTLFGVWKLNNASNKIAELEQENQNLTKKEKNTNDTEINVRQEAGISVDKIDSKEENGRIIDQPVVQFNQTINQNLKPSNRNNSNQEGSSFSEKTNSDNNPINPISSIPLDKNQSRNQPAGNGQNEGNINEGGNLGEKETEVTTKVEVPIQPIASTSTILLPFLELFLTNNEKVEKLDLKTVCPFTPERKKIAFGAFGGIVSYPVENSSDQPFIGFKAGFLIEHNFKIKAANMAFGTEFAYHYRSGNFEATKEQDITSYSFGRSVAQAKLTPENLHYFELPIYLKYQRNRSTFETGLSLNTLLGVQGKVTQPGGAVQSGWIQSLGFKNNYTNLLFGFHYRLNDYLHFGVRANYTPGGILDKTAILPEGITVALQESNPLYFTIRVTHYLNFRK